MRVLGLAIALMIGMSSCVVVVDTPPGPDGYAGRAYFGVDYDYEPPYSYWDNNPSIPTDPYIGEYYPTYGGVYDFEYFIDRDDYWFGTYEIWINPGGPGRANGQRGRDGADTYLLLILNPEGPYEWRKANTKGDYEVKQLSKTKYELTYQDEGGGIKVIMEKADANQRPSDKTPKWSGK